ncbi:MAG: efflux RND transporter periplasmic adaptor subunit [Candidatus Eremiobacteraeota bacterium]|nr:efflux RND transporter periplasmic adaptor subunit [Candidatus Eremiobacteraeota bacterium]
MYKFVIWAIFLVLFICGCTGKSDENTNTASLIPVEVLTARKMDLTEDIELTASIKPYARVAIASKVPGRVLKVHVHDGESVSKGQLLLELDHDDAINQVNQAEAAVKSAEARLNLLIAGPRAQEISQAKAALQSAQADLDDASKNYERMKKLFDQGAISRAELDAAELQLTVKTNLVKTSKEQLSILNEGARPQEIEMARANLSSAKATLEIAKTMLKETYLYAPIEGEVSSRSVEPGDFVVTGAPLLVVNRINPCWAEAYASPDVFAKIKPGQPAEVKVDALPDSTFIGKVQELDPSASEETRNYEIRIKLDNPRKSLKPGMFAEVRISVAEFKNAVIIPLDAIIEKNGDKFAFIVNSDRVQERKLKLGTRINNNVQVKSGIKPGEKVVTIGAENLFDGARVQVVTGTIPE